MRAKFPVTVHLFFFREDQILLIRRFNTGFADGQYSVPAGHLDGGETVIAAARREAQEEGAAQIEPVAIRYSSVLHRIGGGGRGGAGNRRVQLGAEEYHVAGDGAEQLEEGTQPFLDPLPKVGCRAD